MPISAITTFVWYSITTILCQYSFSITNSIVARFIVCFSFAGKFVMII